MSNKELTVEEKAAHWDALINCGRIRILGYARGGAEGKDGAIQHMGVDMWASHSSPTTLNSLELLLEFIEGMIPPSEDTPT